MLNRKYTYKEIENLPEDDPRRLLFMMDLIAHEECDAEAITVNYDDEESQAYFDHYIAGDR